MRFRLKLYKKSGQEIPMNYQYPLSAAIYKIEEEDIWDFDEFDLDEVNELLKDYAWTHIDEKNDSAVLEKVGLLINKKMLVEYLREKK